MRCWIHLANGWTVSISEGDTPPALCCLLGWPTRQDEVGLAAARFHELQLFDFGQGRTDCRCWSLEDVREALNKISSAPPPVL